MTYQLTDSEAVKRLSDGALIPAELGNSDYQGYLRWRDGYTEVVRDFMTGEEIETVVHEPHVPEAADLPPPVVITEVTMRQARLALLQAGQLAAVSAAIAGMPSPQKEAAQIEWEYSNSLSRSNPLVLALGPALGMSAAQLDELFVLASAL
jgi:hypothetical protein